MNKGTEGGKYSKTGGLKELKHRNQERRGKKKKEKKKTYIAVRATSPEKALQVGSEVLPVILLLNPRRPVLTTGTDEHLLRIPGHDAIQRTGPINLQAFRRRRGGSTVTCRRGTCRHRGERRWWSRSRGGRWPPGGPVVFVALTSAPGASGLGRNSEAPPA